MQYSFQKQRSSRFPNKVAAFFLVASLALSGREAAAQQTQLLTHVEEGLSGENHREQSNTTDSVLTDEQDGSDDQNRVEVHYGSVQINVHAAPPLEFENEATLSEASGEWDEAITINNPDHTGESATARFTMHLDGMIANTGAGYSSSGGAWEVNAFQSYAQKLYNNSYYEGASPSQLRTFTADVTFTYGQPIPLNFSLLIRETALSAGTVNGPEGQGAGTFTGNMALRRGSFSVFDGDGNSMSFTADTSAGSAASTNVESGATYGFALTNDTPGRFETGMSIVGGTAVTNQTLQAAFVAPPSTNDVKLVSDAVDFSGTDTNIFVVQLTYDPAAAQSLLGGEGAARLAWLEPQAEKWLNAAAGNNGGTATFVQGPYDAATDFHLGYFGLDVTNHLVWAVINHNSEFGVAAVPANTNLNIQAITQSAAGTIHLQCLGIPNSMNVIQSATNLGAGSFTNQVSIMGDAIGAFHYDDTNAIGQQKFYRLTHPL